MNTYLLNNGNEVPCIGFGTYKSTTGEQEDVLKKAVEAGYRYFDTASFYQNEEELGRVLKESGIPREEFYLTTKVWKTELGYEETKEACRGSMERLETDYLDGYLIHWPKQNPGDTAWKERVWDTWRAMEELAEEKKVRTIGVSNFLVHHLETLLEKARIRPAIDQIEFHPGYMQRETVEFCRKNGILVQAWSPIGRARVLKEPLLLRMAEKYGKSPAQICLRFALEWGVMPLPKSSSPGRMKENMDVFDFSLEDGDKQQLTDMPRTGWSGEHPDRERVYF